jgi:hypothetical protein
MNDSWCPRSIPVCEGLRNGAYCLRCYLCVCKFCFPPFRCLFSGYASNCFRDPVYLCHNFFILLLYFNNRSRPGRSLFNSDKLILLVDSLYADAIEAVKAHAALSASTPKLISTMGDARLWNRSQFVNFSSGLEICFVLMWSRMWNIVGKFFYIIYFYYLQSV